MTRLFFTICLLFTPGLALATTEGSGGVGVQFGHVGLLQDVGDRSGSAIGMGVVGQFVTAEDLYFEVGYLKSNHTRLSHSEITFGFNYYFENAAKLMTHVDAGVVIVSNTLDESPINLTSSGFGIYGGLGIDFDLTKKLKAGLQLRYVKGFEQTVQLANGERIKALQDNVDLLARFIYYFPIFESLK